jgi:hypothetical protein
MTCSVQNQKFELLEAVIRSSNWNCAQQMLAHLRESVPSSYTPIAMALAQRVKVEG